jgi:hypothetical protein
VRVDGILEGQLIENLVEKGDIIRGLRSMIIVFGILASVLSALRIAAPSTPRITTTSAWITTTTSTAARPSSTVPTTPALWGGLRSRLRAYSDIPLSVDGARINRNDSFFIGKLIEQRQAAHIVGILVLAMQNDNYRVVLLLVISLWEMDNVVAGYLVNVHFFPRILRLERGHESSASE